MKKLMMILVAAVCGAAFAVSEDSSRLSFGTPGPDKYADGTTVADGEYYALVWTKTGATFAGFKLDGSVVDPTNSAVICAAPLAKGGKCPTVAFVIDETLYAAYKGNGTLALYLLDTRVCGAAASSRPPYQGDVSLDPKDNGGQVATIDETGRGVQGYALVSGDISASAVPAGVFAASSTDGLEIPSPEIAGIRVEGDEVVLTVKNTTRAINYNVAVGSDPAEAGTAKATAAEPVAGNGTIELRVKKTGDSQFFKVGRNGL